MKAKFREFFEKHRHLIVISLILAVILAALTPLVVPLGLGLDKIINIPPRLRPSQYREVSVWCMQHEEGKCSACYTERDLEELCTTLDRARGKRDDCSGFARELCSFTFDSKIPTTGATYRLITDEGQYKLTTTKNRETFTWQISEQDARQILRYCWCAEDPVPNNPRRVFTDPEQLSSVSLRVYQSGELQTQLSLTRAQIEALCTELEAILQTTATKSLQKTLNALPSYGTVNRWQFTRQDGAVWQLQYTDVSPLLRFCCLSEPQPNGYYDQYWLDVGEDVDLTALNAILDG